MRAGQRAVIRPALDRPLVDAERRQARRAPARGDRRAGIDDLMPADERRQRQVEQLVLPLHDEPPALLVGIEILAPANERRADALAASARSRRARPPAPAARRRTARRACRMPAFSYGDLGSSVSPSLSA